MVSGLGFGLLSAQLRPGERDWDRAYDDTIALTRHAEGLGFHSVWTTEHHFVDDGYMPSLPVVSAAMAAITERIEIGTGVMLAPLHHPLRLAEDAATVSLLSGGRFTLGLGLGWSGVEFAALGADMRLRGRAMDEILAILPKAWSGEVFAHDGTVYDLPAVAVRPVPSHRVPIVVGGGADAALRRAARLADGFFANTPVPRFAQQVKVILDEMERVGRDPAGFRFIHYAILYPASSMEAAWEEAEEHVWQMMWKYGDMEASARRNGPPPAAPPLSSGQRSHLQERAVFAGPPDHLVEQLAAVRVAVDVPVDLVARSYFPTLSTARQVELMDQLAAGVAPFIE
jgi:probable F420-dependent oxidoreductase